MVVLFIAGLFYFWLNVCGQTKKLIKTDSKEQSEVVEANA